MLYKQPFVCPDFCLRLTSSLLQRGARGWASRTTFFSHCQPRLGGGKERILSSRKRLVHPGSNEKVSPQRAKHNIQNRGRGNTPWNNCVLLWSMSRLGGAGRSRVPGSHRQKNVVAGQMPYFALDGKHRPRQQSHAIF